jgi:hypothetical protein
MDHSDATLLSGEDRDDFAKLHLDLIAEFRPVEKLEENLIASLARAVWEMARARTLRQSERTGKV